MGKIIDFVLSDTWEEYKRIQLFKKLGKVADNIQPEQTKKFNQSKQILENFKEI